MEVLVQRQELVCMRNVLKLVTVANRQLLCCLIIQGEFSAEYKEWSIVSTLIDSEEVFSFDLAFLKKDCRIWKLGHHFHELVPCKVVLLGLTEIVEAKHAKPLTSICLSHFVKGSISIVFLLVVVVI